MASNYTAICRENRESYGTKGAQKSGQLAAGLYEDRTHFIFELLQNAEDALGRRGDWQGSRKVAFSLNAASLTLSHFGKPFDEADVRSVCDIAESTKSESSIGRFGLGFKSVYTVTDLPEIHSGDEDFAIENYVFPKQLARSMRAPDETQIVLPLRSGDANAFQDIAAGLRQLGPGALLFLRHIEEISWVAHDGASGFYLRNIPKVLGPNVARVTVIGQEEGKPEVDQNWLVFHGAVHSAEQRKVGRVEIAFALLGVKDAPDRWTLQPLAKSPLVVFFPTVVETHLGFLVQGPYRTTPSRDNVLPADAWNRHLVEQTSDLLVEAMRWMRDNAMLDTSALRCLPLDPEKFPATAMFSPVFESVKMALLNEPLLPRFDGGFVSGSNAKLARTQELRELFSPEQIGELFGAKTAAWLTGDITPDRQPEIRSYLMQQLGIAEVTPATLVPRLAKSFLEAQADDWVLRLYEFLSGQEAALRRSLDKVPLVRLNDGTQVVARENGNPRAFLPSSIKTGFPTVRPAVCSSAEAQAFLITLGLTEPDLVDDVMLNLLPKYEQDEVSLADYAADIERIQQAYATDSVVQREKLRSALRNTSFVASVHAGDDEQYLSSPGEVYIATERLRQLFSDVPEVYLVDTNHDCLRGVEIRELLESCGALRHLRPVSPPYEHHWSERLRELRLSAGHPETSGVNDRVEDWSLLGLPELLEVMLTLEPEQRIERARLIWESLGDLEDRRGRGVFEGTYSWTHNGKYATTFPAAFLRTLNEAAWVPDATGDLVLPSRVLFDSLGWKANPFLLSRISFKPPIIDQLAKEAGFDPACLDLLHKLGLTNFEDLRSRLGIDEQQQLDYAPPAEGAPVSDPPNEERHSNGRDIYDAASDLYGDDMPDIQPGTPDPDGGDGVTGRSGRGGQTGAGYRTAGGGGNRQGGSSSHTHAGDKGSNADGGGRGKRTPGSAGGRPFISYVGTHPNDEGADPDGLDQAARMRLEDRALSVILSLEPRLQRTPQGNPGFDLVEVDDVGRQVRWVEVKSMTGSLQDRPVGISSTQFDFASAKGDAFWLYVVEHATEPEKARVLKIQNPVAHARTFTFDKGWSQIAMSEPLHKVLLKA